MLRLPPGPRPTATIRSGYGLFDDRARAHSLELWARMRRAGLLVAATVLAAATILVRRRG